MELQKFDINHPIPSGDFERLYDLLAASLPGNEMRSKEGQKGLVSLPEYAIYALFGAQGGIDAFLAAWEFEPFRFIEHFAVDAALRGGGIGKKMLCEYLSQSQKPVVLEAEPPEGGLAARRVRFYERSGFHLNPQEYWQIPLKQGDLPLRLCVMSWPSPLSDEEFKAVRSTLYTKVYGQTP